jgi:hypothetical protein
VSVTAILLPVFVQVALTFAVLFRLGFMRLRAIRAGRVQRERAAIDDTAWPLYVRKAGNCLRNQFELPVLFYAVVGFALVTRQADLPFVVLSWLFVLSRIVHAGVHVTFNDVAWRFGTFAFGALVLLALWILFALGILLSPVLP